MLNAKRSAPRLGSYQNNSALEPGPMRRGFCTASGTGSDWKAPSITAACKALPGLGGKSSDDAKLLVVLLCFFADSEVPINLLFRGATPRKRWNDRGEIEEADALRAGLCPELVDLLSDMAKLGHVLYELQSLSAISTNFDQTYKSYVLDRAVLARVSSNLPPEFHSFWRVQALVVTYRSIPWKYIEPGTFHMKALFVSHIRHAVQEARNHGDFRGLSENTSADLVSALVEASRFPNTKWKQSAIDHAKEAMQGLKDKYLQPYIAQKECLLHRITGDMEQAARAIENASLDPHLEVGTDERMHAGSGYVAIQRALNHVQVEELGMAIAVLESWKPLHQEPPSALEQVVLFRKHVLLGRISRFQGKFTESLTHLERSKTMADQHKYLFFDEDRCDLIANLADTLQELGIPAGAEKCLRAEMAHQGRDLGSAEYLLKLALADSLFAQGQHSESEALCLEVQSHPRLPKMGKLRLSITQAKLCHINGKWERAFDYWTEALRVVDQFTRTNGYTTRIILLSICDVLRHQEQHDLELRSRDRLTSLEKLAGRADGLYWIAGLQQWLNYLQSAEGSRRSHL